ncbi:nucleoside deaminase [Corynebacterium sp. ES2794-CONJ1]|uniref:nucleoside deaminase n=1 Tax=unclassified Corynebacterium TaxID=2624378 RepID=UPI00216AB511|nr:MULTISPECIES: nucleoside deaminase [unclassified Corynebacterium]MCS4532372.1 nucleoside deaminase [Corynebacterium sp. ES2730-CONJ]MCU9519665.1 nucleoside deaminase [Corynebacterium sp. ES2794-CONJ1]
MRRALAEATRCPGVEIPVGAVVINAAGDVIGMGHNRRETDRDPFGHAEMMALAQAAQHHDDGWRLTGCTLVVTLEPCAMCAGAAVSARIDHIIFGAFEPKTGACGSWIDIPRAPLAVHSPQVSGGVLGDECASLLRQFFRSLR